MERAKYFGKCRVGSALSRITLNKHMAFVPVYDTTSWSPFVITVITQIAVILRARAISHTLNTLKQLLFSGTMLS